MENRENETLESLMEKLRQIIKRRQYEEWWGTEKDDPRVKKSSKCVNKWLHVPKPVARAFYGKEDYIECTKHYINAQHRTTTRKCWKNLVVIHDPDQDPNEVCFCCGHKVAIAYVCYRCRHDK